MTNNKPLTSEERMEIVEYLKRGNLSHRAIAQQFKRSQSTVSTIAKDAGVTPTHRRRRTPAARDVESTYNEEGRVNFVDRIIGVLDGMVSDGGLTPRDMKELTTAAKAALDARRSEDVESAEEKKEDDEVVWGSAFAVPGESPGIGFKKGSFLHKAMVEVDEELEREWQQQQGHPGEEYGSSLADGDK